MRRHRHNTSFSLAMRCHRHNQASTGAKRRCEPCIAVGDGGTAVAGSGGPSWTGFSASCLINTNFSNNKITANTPWKNNIPQLKNKQHNQGGLSTVLEEQEFPPIVASSINKSGTLETILDKFMSFMLNIFLEILSIESVRVRFKHFAEALNETEQSNLSGVSSL